MPQYLPPPPSGSPDDSFVWQDWLVRLREIIYDFQVSLRATTGTNGKIGTATLVGGTVTVPNTKVKATSYIFLSRKQSGGTLGHLSYSITPGTSLTITSSSATETSTISYLIVEPS